MVDRVYYGCAGPVWVGLLLLKNGIFVCRH